MSVVQSELADTATQIADETNLKQRESLRDQSRIICKWIYNGLQKTEQSFNADDLSNVVLGKSSTDNFGRLQGSLSGSTNRHRDVTVSYL